MRPFSHATFISAAAACLCAVPALGQVQELETGAFVIEHQVTVPGNTDTAYDHFVDVDSWWDHRFSESPSQFYIEARPGGGFYEIFDATGDGVLHATVIYADRGRLLRFVGPLGLSGRAIELVSTLAFGSVGDSTRVSASIHGTGEALGRELVDTVGRAWRHFLTRYKAFVEGRLE